MIGNCGNYLFTAGDAVPSNEIDLTVTGNTSMGTNSHPFDQAVLILNVMFEETARAGVVVACSVSIGFNSPNFNNILPATSLGLASILSPPQFSGRKIDHDVEIFFRVITAATGVGVSLKIRPYLQAAELSGA
jgi:hypothetical protein